MFSKKSSHLLIKQKYYHESKVTLCFRPQRVWISIHKDLLMQKEDTCPAPAGQLHQRTACFDLSLGQFTGRNNNKNNASSSKITPTMQDGLRGRRLMGRMQHSLSNAEIPLGFSWNVMWASNVGKQLFTLKHHPLTGQCDLWPYWTKMMRVTGPGRVLISVKILQDCRG